MGNAPSAQIAVAPPLGVQALGIIAGNGILGRAVQAAVIGSALYQQGRHYYDRWREGHTYTIRVSSRDDIYPDVHRWLLDQMPEHEQRSLIAHTSRRNDAQSSSALCAPSSYGGRDQPKPTVRYQYDGNAQVHIRIDGHPVIVTLDRDAREGPKEYAPPEDKIVFSVQSNAGRRAVAGVIESIALRQVTDDAPRVYVMSWGQWVRTSAMVARDPDTVVLAEGQMRRLSGDIAQFLASRERFARIGAPWHRGYLLHGPPGGGKTSAARALASTHHLDVYYLPLSDITSDTGLAQLIANIADRSVLLIEDIDIASAATSREEGSERLTLQGLLNALDGVMTPNGLITIMTTNHPDRLDPALTRKGRCDVTEEIGYLTDEQLGRLVAITTERFGPLPMIGDRQIVASEITEIVKANITDMDAARAAIVEYLMEEQPAMDQAG